LDAAQALDPRLRAPLGYVEQAARICHLDRCPPAVLFLFASRMRRLRIPFDAGREARDRWAPGVFVPCEDGLYGELDAAGPDLVKAQNAYRTFCHNISSVA